jgi:hypothetical protein
MYLGVVPDVLPLAPRPVTNELRSSWLLRVAAANVRTLAELLDAVAERHPHAGTDDAFLDHALSSYAAAAFAQFARMPETAVRALDLSHQLPGLPEPWILRMGLHRWSRDRLSDRRAGYAFCPRCLGSVAPMRPPHLPVEWACAVVTYCPIHRTRLQERCPACFVDDPFFVGVLEHAGHAECWQCQAVLRGPTWSADGRVGVDDVVQLQTMLLAAMRGHAPALRGVESLSAGEVIALVEDLVNLLIEADPGEPPFARVAALHWPADLGLIRVHIRPSDMAHFPVAWRFIVMAITAAVLAEAADAPSNAPTERGALPHGPLHTLVGSLADAEWQHWEARMAAWPTPVRDRVRTARQQMSAD